MGTLDGRVAVVTGGGRGIGREEALLLAAEGARVVVNDLGTELDGTGTDASVAQAVVDEITATGGTAVANTDDVSTWDGAQGLIQQAVDTYGDLHVLVNTAGNVRDRVLVNMSEEDWDLVIRTHLKGTFAPTRHAAAHWRQRAKEENPTRNPVVLNTSSTSGLIGQPGQSNYGAAKAGIAAFTVIVAQELTRIGARANVIVPAARTRMTLGTPGLADQVREPEDPSQFDSWHPANVAPLAALLAQESCDITGKVFFVRGGQIRKFENWQRTATIEQDDRWSIGDLAQAIEKVL
jgi:NAD(P)-dependent dehydrogenase (short-subunit alcohol dehydrogenase family)